MTIIKIVGRLNYIPDKKALLISFLITLSGCASVSNSERFYQDQSARTNQLARIYDGLTFDHSGLRSDAKQHWDSR